MLTKANIWTTRSDDCKDSFALTIKGLAKIYSLELSLNVLLTFQKIVIKYLLKCQSILFYISKLGICNCLPSTRVTAGATWQIRFSWKVSHCNVKPVSPYQIIWFRWYCKVQNSCPSAERSPIWFKRLLLICVHHPCRHVMNNMQVAVRKLKRKFFRSQSSLVECRFVFPSLFLL